MSKKFKAKKIKKARRYLAKAQAFSQKKLARTVSKLDPERVKTMPPILKAILAAVLEDQAFKNVTVETVGVPQAEFERIKAMMDAKAGPKKP